jgi:AGCS family alanine or glycine:cation symporter
MTTIMYITMSFSVICVNFSNMSSAFSSILSGAFSPLAAGGGIIALLVSDSMREGFARGMLSNEAGAGTSTLAHATGGSLHPARRGIFGIIEVFFDTAFLCMMSGISILLAVPDPSSYDNGMALLLAAVTGSLGEWLALPLVLSVCAFAYSTVVCWYYYGASSISLLIGKPGGMVFGILYLAFVFVGSIIPSGLLVFISDALLLLLSLLTLPTVIKSSDRVLRLSEQIGLVGYNSE